MPGTSLSPVLRTEQNMDISYQVIHSIVLLLLNLLNLYILLLLTCFHYFLIVFIWKQWPIPIIRYAPLINTTIHQPSLSWPSISTFSLLEKDTPILYHLSSHLCQLQYVLFCLVRQPIEMLIVFLYFLSSVSRKYWFFVGTAK